jgi:hypothetical protein
MLATAKSKQRRYGRYQRLGAGHVTRGICFDPALLSRLEHEAKQQGISVSAFIAEATRAALNEAQRVKV